jgi:nucleoside-diphosphate-sugar epimerase
MKLFVTGATGVIGRRAVPRLVASGHTVTGVARSEEKARSLRDVGAKPVQVDLFDPDALVTAVAGHDAVVNLATKIPPPSRAVIPRAWAENTRIRSVASRHLVEAATVAGVSRFLQESICFIYPDRGEEWIDEDVPLQSPAVGAPIATAEAHTQQFTDAGGIGVVLRFGQFYAPESTYTRWMCRMARLRLPAVPGPRHAYTPALSAEDAASAVVAALDAPAGTYNVADDDPLTREAFNRAVAGALGAKPPLTTGTALLRLNKATAFYLRSQRVSNRRFRRVTSWKPQFADASQGWLAMAEDLRRPSLSAPPTSAR